MQLDFTAIVGNLALDSSHSRLEAPLRGIENDSNINAQEDVKGANMGLDLSLIQAPVEIENNTALITQYQREQAVYDRAREVYRDYQDAIKVSEMERGEILKGIGTGQPIEPLFLKACDIVAKMTGDKSFYTQIEDRVVSIYGEGMQAKAPLEHKLKGVQKRLNNMEQAINREGIDSKSREQIQRAIDSHKAEEKRLQSMIDNSLLAAGL